ncbi:glycosyltransferase [Halomonas alkalicola]|uniref:Glycosyltransferase n=1 Tax=Halomonas alkalicola TaxID=1930622 RepID=A0ABY9H5I6_9GAMM|nr:glycosyltransferase [Halomonas alkalicola]WLI73747.1 glycosyltransferase [Halomonas alkalicola]
MAKKIKFITYHSYSSNGIGGVEELIRSLQLIAETSGLRPVEIYLKGDNGHVFESMANVTKIKYPGVFYNFKFIDRINRALFLRRALDALDVGVGDFLVLFDPKQLLLLPAKVKSNCKIILVQVNRVDKLFKTMSSKISVWVLKQNIFAFTVYTDFDKKELVERFPFLVNKVKVIPRACKLKTSSETARHSKRLVTVARIDEKQKNFFAMVAIFKSLPQDYSLEIYGDGPPDELCRLEEIIKGVKNVRYMGVVRDVSTVLKKNSIFIMTSHYEGFGQTLIEARSQGLPVVAYDSFKSASWVVKDGVTGFLVEPNNISGFVEKLMLIGEDKKIYNYLSNNSIHFAKETEREKIDCLWEKVLTSARAGLESSD